MGYFAQGANYKSQPVCACLELPGYADFVDCDINRAKRSLCEENRAQQAIHPSTNDASKQPGTRLSISSFSAVHVQHAFCPSDHWTHTFLACDVRSYCWGQGRFRQGNGSDAERNLTSLCQSTLSTLFTCRHEAERVPYSLVCDHSQDCLDASDEDFCAYPSCSASKQSECVNKQVCNSKKIGGGCSCWLVAKHPWGKMDEERRSEGSREEGT